MRRGRRWAGVGAILVGIARVGQAQGPGLPVMNPGVPRGFTIATMAGFGNDAAGGGTAFSLAGTAGFRRFAIGGFVSRLRGSTLDDGSVAAGGGNLTIKVAGGPLVPVSINFQAGLGYYAPGYSTSQTFKTWRAPVGLGISWTIPRPVVALKPWIAPRVDIRRITTPDPLADPVPGGPIPTITSTESEFGLSGGINFGLIIGLGIDVAVDRVFAQGARPTTVGVGLSYTFK